MNRPTNPVVGKCWACGKPVRAFESSRVLDRATGLHRRVHASGGCKERAEILMSPKIEGMPLDD